MDVMEYDSVCYECKNCVWEGNGKDEPETCFCDECMDNFGTNEGCYRFEERRGEFECS